MRTLGLTSFAAASLFAVAAAAPRPASAVELALEGQLGYFDMAASQSATAVFGSSDGLTYGGALRLTFWHGLFFEAGARTFSKEGERVFVVSPDAPVQKLGHPLEITSTPLFFSLGYRFRAGNTLVPYVSAGYTHTRYEETSTVAGQSFDVDESKSGFTGAAGLEVGRGIFRLAGEVGYTTTSDSLGFGGVSRVYEEDDLGGFHAVGKVVIAFGL